MESKKRTAKEVSESEESSSEEIATGSNAKVCFYLEGGGFNTNYWCYSPMCVLVHCANKA